MLTNKVLVPVRQGVRFTRSAVLPELNPETTTDRTMSNLSERPERCGWLRPFEKMDRRAQEHFLALI